jgi:hypothetical protein
VCFVVKAKGTECGGSHLGGELALLYLERVGSIERADSVSHQHVPEGDADDALPNFRSAGWLILLSLDLQIADGTPLADKP